MTWMLLQNKRLRNYWLLSRCAVGPADGSHIGSTLRPSAAASLAQSTQTLRSRISPRTTAVAVFARSELHRWQVMALPQFPAGLEGAGLIMVAGIIQARLKPCALGPFPAKIRQAIFVVIAVVDPTLSKNRFPNVHDLSSS